MQPTIALRVPTNSQSEQPTYYYLRPNSGDDSFTLYDKDLTALPMNLRLSDDGSVAYAVMFEAMSVSHWDLVDGYGRLIKVLYPAKNKRSSLDELFSNAKKSKATVRFELGDGLD